MTDDRYQIHVTLPDTEREAVQVESMKGSEALGRAYEFTVDLVSPERLALEPMLGNAATLEMSVHDEDATIHGVIAAARMRDPTHAGQYCYQVVIVPELAMLRHSAQNQVYGTDQVVTLPDIVEAEMRDASKSSSKTADHRLPRDLAFEVLLDRDAYPELPFVMQYRETDYDFVCRLLEKYGATFRFDHAGGREKVVFIDRKEHLPALAGRQIGENLPYRARTRSAAHDRLAIRSFNAEYAVQSGTVALREYNWLTPGVDMDVTHGASFEGQGVMTYYGEHYRTQTEGDLLARRRAELMTAQRLTFRGTSDIPLMRPGLYFRLDGHPDRTLDGQYTIVEVDHNMTPLVQQGYGDAEGTAVYENSFTCIPFDTEYRPPLRTPRPIVHGHTPGVITDGPDDWGNYTVRIIEDESSGETSHPVRKAEFTTSGDGRGVATRLEHGTEVLLVYRHGNPDRPLIVGAVSNAEQTSTINSDNQNVAYLQKTTSGIVFHISDSTG